MGSCLGSCLGAPDSCLRPSGGCKGGGHAVGTVRYAGAPMDASCCTPSNCASPPLAPLSTPCPGADPSAKRGYRLVGDVNFAQVGAQGVCAQMLLRAVAWVACTSLVALPLHSLTRGCGCTPSPYPLEPQPCSPHGPYLTRPAHTLSYLPPPCPAGCGARRVHHPRARRCGPHDHRHAAAQLRGWRHSCLCRRQLSGAVVPPAAEWCLRCQQAGRASVGPAARQPFAM